MINKIVKLGSDDIVLTTYVIDKLDCYESKRRAIIICPGGGYHHLSSKESEPLALEFMAKGISAFVLSYSLDQKARYPQPLFDLSDAFKYVKEHAQEFNIDPSKISILGFSAGGHLTAMFGAMYNKELLLDKYGVSKDYFKPASLILGYPLIDYKQGYEIMDSLSGAGVDAMKQVQQFVVGSSEPTEQMLKAISPLYLVDDTMPRTFIWHTTTDELVYANTILKYALELQNHGIAYELHLFEKGIHGGALAKSLWNDNQNQISIRNSKWFDLAVMFLEEK